MGYRENFFKANPGVRFPFRRGSYYRCVNCGGWFSKSQIEIDHRVPKRYGGTDELYNLQPMCRPCNRRKSAKVRGSDIAGTAVRAAVSGNLGNMAGGIAKRKAKDALGIKYRRK